MAKTSPARLQRRAAKAAKRKKMLAERRKTTIPSSTSLAGLARRAAAEPIYRCLFQKALFEGGEGIVLLARGTPATGFAVGGFLIDGYCLGVKDSFLHAGIEEREVEALIAATELSAPLEPAAPGYARKLVEEAAAYARSIGIQPHKDFAAVKAMFGDVIADAGDATFSFGFEGKPLYIAGPEDTPAQIRRRLEALRKAVGENGFDVDLSAYAAPAFDDDLLYDPETAPDPESWLKADEDECLQAVLAYHEDAEEHDDLEDEKREVHAGLHVTVENQLAANEPPAARRALDRLLAEGLDRHDAIHAIASVLLGEMVPSVREHRDFSQQAYEKALEELTVKSWRRETSDEKGED